MKCICPGCRSSLYVANEQLKTKSNDVFNCPKCETKIHLQPSVAKCGSCAGLIKYFDYKFDKKSPLAKCSHCQSINRLKLKD